MLAHEAEHAAHSIAQRQGQQRNPARADEGEMVPDTFIFLKPEAHALRGGALNVSSFQAFLSWGLCEQRNPSDHFLLLS